VKRMEAATKPGAVRVEIVRRIYGGRLIDRDPKRLLDEFATPDIEYVDPAEAVDPGTRRGRAEVGRALRRARQSFPSYEHELDELFDRGDAVVAAVTFRGVAGGARARSSSDGRIHGPCARAGSCASSGVAIWRQPSKQLVCGSGSRRGSSRLYTIVGVLLIVVLLAILL
jgi:ketosteroid isomerase-like protein